MQTYSNLFLSQSQSVALEHDTRQQGATDLWHLVRSSRLTSSNFKAICSRRGDFEGLALRLKEASRKTTRAMRRGLAQEPIAAQRYTAITGNQVFPCGFVVNPHAPHLGTSPDRRVVEEEDACGLLEIKCPSKTSYKECSYLVEKLGGGYKLNENHAHYFQVMGQLGLTGMPWCDFFVMGQEDHHLERIYFDAEKWAAMKIKLDWFFFYVFLNHI